MFLILTLMPPARHYPRPQPTSYEPVHVPTTYSTENMYQHINILSSSPHGTTTIIPCPHLITSGSQVSIVQHPPVTIHNHMGKITHPQHTTSPKHAACHPLAASSRAIYVTYHTHMGTYVQSSIAHHLARCTSTTCVTTLHTDLRPLGARGGQQRPCARQPHHAAIASPSTVSSIM